MKKDVYKLKRINGQWVIFKNKYLYYCPDLDRFIFDSRFVNHEGLLISALDFKQYKKAVQLARIAHKGQVDKSGKPYFLHPCRVSRKVECEGWNSHDIVIAMSVGILHDVVEDTKVKLKDIDALGFYKEIIIGVFLMTKEDGKDYLDYVKEMRNNKYAVEVKKSDLRDNMRIERIPNPGPKDYARIEKYKIAYKLLSFATE